MTKWINSFDEKNRFVKVVPYHNEPDGQVDSHGMSYLGWRECLKKNFGDKMAFDALGEIELVDETREAGK
jgi:hypothetical protein